MVDDYRPSCRLIPLADAKSTSDPPTLLPTRNNARPTLRRIVLPSASSKSSRRSGRIPRRRSTRPGASEEIAPESTRNRMPSQRRGRPGAASSASMNVSPIRRILASHRASWRNTMNAIEFFLVQHAQVHVAEAGARPSYFDRTLAGLTNDQMRVRPGKNLNPIVWLLWHMARTEDVAVNLVVANGPQVLDDEWTKRMSVRWRIIGTGMSDGEVDEMSKSADVGAVRAYRAAVAQRTRDVVRTLRADAWDEIIGFADTSRGAAAGAFAPTSAWVEGVGYTPWQGQSRAAQLGASAIRHNALHLGEAITIRSLAGFPLGV
ncbi:MAG: hypothetical protein DMD81_10315 [Candidatus Rokuibacteriota bacterium]|nr:MAG: hypothetical protein DMD81_10315 [Candidatus Rokubacteria bacterium]